MAEASPAGDVRSVYDIMRRISIGADVRTVLDEIAEGVVRAGGFEVAAISWLNREHQFEFTSVAGSASARAALVGRKDSLEEVERELVLSDEWGELLFLPAERVGEDAMTGWIPELPEQPDGVEDAWQPNDTLRAPLRSPEGELLGMLCVDLPADGLRPGRERRELLEMYADIAGVALSNARHAEELEDRLRLASTVESIHNEAGRQREITGLLGASAEPIARALGADLVFVQAFDGQDGSSPGAGARWPPPMDDGPEPPPGLLDSAADRARQAWARRTVETTRVREDLSGEPSEHRIPEDIGHVRAAEAPLDGVARRPVAGGVAGWVRTVTPTMQEITEPDQERLRDFMASYGARTAMMTPLGIGDDCLGYVVAFRLDMRSWATYEIDAAAQAARNLSQAILNARAASREAEVVAQLEALDRYTSELITTVSHELRTPLTSIKGHLELIADDPAGAPPESYRVVQRNMERMQGLIDDLLTLNRLSDSGPLDPGSVVDVAQVARDAVASLRVRAGEGDVDLRLTAPPGPLLIGGDHDELERVALNLIANAITYTPAGGRVEVECQRSDRFVRLICSDTGMGISKADQEELFTEFYRTNNPDALALPGTGLGLAIVRRIVQRHVGSIRLDSDTGQGSTFTVRLPVSHV